MNDSNKTTDNKNRESLQRKLINKMINFQLEIKLFFNNP